MSGRAVKHVRSFLGARLRALRKQRGMSQEKLGERSDLSGKFIGEVERGEKSISMDSLFRVAQALGVHFQDLTDVEGGRMRQSKEAHQIFALVSGRSKADLERALEVLTVMFRKK